jgi:hypothetical protein
MLKNAEPAVASPSEPGQMVIREPVGAVGYPTRWVEARNRAIARRLC